MYYPATNRHCSTISNRKQNSYAEYYRAGIGNNHILQTQIINFINY